MSKNLNQIIISDKNLQSKKLKKKVATIVQKKKL